MMSPDSIHTLSNWAFKRFPPRLGHIVFPVESKGAALAGMALYPACATRAVWFQRVVYDWVKIFGPRRLPWRSERWKPPMDEEVWRDLCSRWREAVGDFDTFAVSERRPISRAGFMVLLVRRNRPIAFVKVRQDDEGLGREFRALEAVTRFAPRSFQAPEPLSIGEVENWSFLVMSALQPGIHKMPGRSAIDHIGAEISSSLGSLSRPEGTPEHWRPMHGDLTPWNLRRTRAGGLVLVDWEYACWAPPQSDEVFYNATLSMVGREVRSETRASEEAVEFWKRKMSERAGQYRKQFREALLARIEAQARGDGVKATFHYSQIEPTTT
jgi:hypothetical protein